MQFEQKPDRLGGIGRYFMKAVRFYDLKDDNLTRIVFVIMLSGSLISFFLPNADKIDPINIAISLVISFIVNLALSLYLFAFLKELKGQLYTMRDGLKFIAKKSATLTVAFAIYYFSTIAATIFLLIIPGLILYIMFMFYQCYIIDKDKGVFDAFRESRKLTRGYRWRLFSTIISFNLVLLLPTLIIVSAVNASGNKLVQVFILYFMLNLINLMLQRLTAMMYRDLEYGQYDDFEII